MAANNMLYSTALQSVRARLMDILSQFEKDYPTSMLPSAELIDNHRQTYDARVSLLAVIDMFPELLDDIITVERFYRDSGLQPAQYEG